MEMTLTRGFMPLEMDELLAIDGGWSWSDTFMVVGAAAIIVGAAIVIGASAPLSVPVAVAIGATTGKTIGLVGSVTLGIGVTSR
jgi:hypothetical protein